MTTFVRTWIRASVVALPLFACLTPAQTAVVVGGGQKLVDCVAAELVKGDDTFEGLALACGPVTIAEIIGVVETLAASPTTTTGALAMKAHHKNEGK